MFALSLLPLITLVKTAQPNLIRLSLQFLWRLFPGLGGGIKGGD